MPTMITTSDDRHDVSDELTVLFGGKIWPRQVLEAYWAEIDQLLKGERYCVSCQGIDDCKMYSLGWQVVYDVSGSEQYLKPVFRVQQCRHYKANERQKKEEQLFTARTMQQTFATFRLNYDNTEMFNRCQDYALNFSPFTTHGLLLVGSFGTGKTHLAAAIAKDILRRGYEVDFVKVPTLLDDIRASFNSEERAAMPIFSRVRKRFVVFDDLGAERPNEWVIEQLFKIIDYRSENFLPTVITSNLSIPALEQKIGKRTVDRVLGICDMVTVKGEGWRRKKEADKHG